MHRGLSLGLASTRPWWRCGNEMEPKCGCQERGGGAFATIAEGGRKADQGRRRAIYRKVCGSSPQSISCWVFLIDLLSLESVWSVFVFTDRKKMSPTWALRFLAFWPLLATSSFDSYDVPDVIFVSLFNENSSAIHTFDEVVLPFASLVEFLGTGVGCPTVMSCLRWPPRHHSIQTCDCF